MLSYQDYLEQFGPQEFTPTEHVDVIFKELLPTHIVLHIYSPNHYLIKVIVSDMLNTNMTNWEYNRPPDDTRCQEIATYIHDKKPSLDTMFYLSFTNKTQTFSIYDGIHRYTALKIINNNKNTDLLDLRTFGSNSEHICKQYVILNIRFNATNGELIEAFQTLNKSISVPTLYLRDTSRDKKDTIENIVNEWQIKYKTHFSASSKPNRPNINREMFINLLDDVYEKYKHLDNNNPQDYLKLLKEKLCNANEYCKDPNNRPKDIKNEAFVKLLAKCYISNCFLFLHKHEKLIDII